MILKKEFYIKKICWRPCSDLLLEMFLEHAAMGAGGMLLLGICALHSLIPIRNLGYKRHSKKTKQKKTLKETIMKLL